MADASDFGQLGAWPAGTHLLPGIAGQEIGFSAADHQRRAGDTFIERPQIDILPGKGRLERLGDSGIVAEGPTAIGTLDDAGLGQMMPLRLGQRPNGSLTALT